MKIAQSLVVAINVFPDVDIENCLETMVESASVMGATVLESAFYRNSDTEMAYVVLGESHMALHVLRQHNFAVLNIMTCGSCDPEKGYEYLKEHLGFSDCGYNLSDIYFQETR